MSLNIAYCDGMDPKDYSVTSQIFPDERKVGYHNYAKTYQAVVDGECDYAVMPFEKSLAGEIGYVFDLLYKGDLKICATHKVFNDGEKVRYAIITKEEPEERGDNDLFMIMFTVEDKTGSLAKAINVISDHGFNMRMLSSRAMGDLAWHYYFYVEAVGNDKSAAGQEMMSQLTEMCESIKVVGRYLHD